MIIVNENPKELNLEKNKIYEKSVFGDESDKIMNILIEDNKIEVKKI